MFCKYFNEVFIKEESWNDDITQQATEDICVAITEVKVKKLLSALKMDKLPEPDGIHPLFLHNAVDDVAKPLTLIFNKLLMQGELPHDWKQANK